jgi:DNA-binding protein WhiA
VTDSTSTFAADVRAELAAIAPSRRCDRLAELSALFHAAGNLHLRGRGEVTLHLDLATSSVARRAFSLLRSLAIDSEIRTYERHAFDRATRFQLHVAGGPDALATLVEAGVLGRHHGPLSCPPRRLVRRACCRGAYLRGAFLAGGSLSLPRSPHLELRTASRDGADFLRAAAADAGIELAVGERSGHARAYGKSLETIEGILGLAGAIDAVLALEERAVLADARSQANRLANGDHANLVRTTRAAQEQLEAARLLRAVGTLETLDDRLREAGELRLRFPSLSLAELAAKAQPPATKAGMHRRLRRIMELAGDGPV